MGRGGERRNEAGGLREGRGCEARSGTTASQVHTAVRGLGRGHLWHHSWPLLHVRGKGFPGDAPGRGIVTQECDCLLPGVACDRGRGQGYGLLPDRPTLCLARGLHRTVAPDSRPSHLACLASRPAFPLLSSVLAPSQWWLWGPQAQHRFPGLLGLVQEVLGAVGG